MAGDNPIKGGVDTSPASPAPVIPEDAAQDDAANLVEAWFFQNFEDPARGMPRNGHDDGFYFTHGGPYSAADILSQVFQNRLSDSEINYLASQIERDNDAWVPSSGRRLPPDDEAEWDRAEWDRNRWPDPVTAAHVDMLSRIEDVERTLAVADASDGGIGHNRPPGSIDEPALPPIDREEIGRALALLKSQPVQPDTTAFVPIEVALKVIGRAAATVGVWLAARANDFVVEGVKAAGKVAGTGLAGWGVWHQLDADLQALVVAGFKWAGIINPLF